jgi:hypothetical protein
MAYRTKENLSLFQEKNLHFFYFRFQISDSVLFKLDQPRNLESEILFCHRMNNSLSFFFQKFIRGNF